MHALYHHHRLMLSTAMGNPLRRPGILKLPTIGQLHRNPEQLVHQISLPTLSPFLVTHSLNGFRGSSDGNNILFPAAAGERGIFRKESIPRWDSIGARTLYCINDLLLIEETILRAYARQWLPLHHLTFTKKGFPVSILSIPLVLMPISRQVRITRMAISPRLAISTFGWSFSRQVKIRGIKVGKRSLI